MDFCGTNPHTPSLSIVETEQEHSNMSTTSNAESTPIKTEFNNFDAENNNVPRDAMATDVLPLKSLPLNELSARGIFDASGDDDPAPTSCSNGIGRNEFDVDECDAESNTSSLESIPKQVDGFSTAAGTGGDCGDASSTSCSTDSFELSSPSVAEPPKEAAPKEDDVMQRSQRPNPFLFSPEPVRREPIRAIGDEDDFDDIDTAMPSFDFEKLERQLNSARREREELAEKVRYYYIFIF